MDIRYSAKGVKVTEEIKEHIQEKMHKFERFAPRLVEAHVILKKEKYMFEAEVTLLAKKMKAVGKANSKDNIYVALDGAYMRVETQLKKFRGKVKDHHRQAKQKVKEQQKEEQELMQGGLTDEDY